MTTINLRHRLVRFVKFIGLFECSFFVLGYNDSLLKDGNVHRAMVCCKLPARIADGELTEVPIDSSTIRAAAKSHPAALPAGL